MNTADTMWKAWGGKYPTNRCPEIRWIGSSLKQAKVKRNKPFSLDVDVTDPDGDSVRYQWSLMSEKKNKVGDGTVATELKPVTGRLTNDTLRSARILTPSATGPYRVFIHVYDGHGNASSANMPFFVEP